MRFVWEILCLTPEGFSPRVRALYLPYKPNDWSITIFLPMAKCCFYSYLLVSCTIVSLHFVHTTWKCINTIISTSNCITSFVLTRWKCITTFVSTSSLTTGFVYVPLGFYITEQGLYHIYKPLYTLVST